MPEALTESFCERCGTRYEFTAPTRLNPLRRGRGLVTGLKNYIMSQDTLSDTVGDAMRTEADSLATTQLDAFHAAFNFCIDCRQYTCTNCWNDGAGRCRSCAPIAGTDDLLERFEASFAAQHPLAHGADTELDGANVAARLGIDAWPSADPVAGPTSGYPDVPWPEDLVLAEGNASAGVVQPAEPAYEPEPERTVAAEPAYEPDIPAYEPEPEPVAAFEAPRLVVLEWEPDTDFELLPDVVAEQPAYQPAVVEAWAEVEPVAEVELEPVAEVELEPEPVPADVVAATTEVAEPPAAPGPIRQTVGPITDSILRLPHPAAPSEARPAAAAPQAADDPLAAARRAQLDLLGLDDPGEGVVRPDRPRVLPYLSRGAAMPVGNLAARAAHNQGTTAFWDASAREVADAMSAVGVQNCGQCGLSLSATARFCRRCGTRQAQPA